MINPQPINFDEGIEFAVNTTPEVVESILKDAIKSVEIEEWGSLRVEIVEHFSGSAYSLTLHTDRGGGSTGLIFLDSDKGGTLIRIPPGRGSTVPFTSFAMDPDGALFGRYLAALVENFMQLNLLDVDWGKRWLGLLATSTIKDTPANGG